MKGIVDLVAVARNYPARALPAGHHQSYPAPLLQPGGLKIAFLYCRGEIAGRGRGLSLTAPSYMALVDAKSGLFEELRAVTPAALGLDDAEGKVLGETFTPAESVDPARLTQEMRLAQAYDTLLPAFAAGMTEIDAAGLAAASEHRRLFAELAEAPLGPYYRAVSGPFFAWRDRLASLGERAPGG